MRPPKAHSAKRSKRTAWSTNWALETLTAQWDGSRTLWPPQAAHLQSQRFFQLQLASPERSGDRLHPVPSARGHGEPETPERGSCSNQDSCDVYLRRTQVEAERTSPKSGLEQGEQLSHSRRLDTHFRQRLPFTQFAINRARPPPRRSLGGPITAHPAIQPCQLPSRHWVNLNWYK
jgi:hypothetical protein